MPDHEEAVREARRVAIESLTSLSHHGSCKANHERVRDHGDCDCGEWGDAAVLIDAVAATSRASERAKYAALVEAARAVVHYQSPHGHVTPRPDGVKARCGGPKLCISCGVEAALAALQSKEGAEVTG